jgi:hypothetical protein
MELMADTFRSGLIKRTFRPPLGKVFQLVALAIMPVSVMTGCSTTKVMIISEPPGALIQANGANIGKAPVNYQLDFSKVPTVVVTASKTGYFNEQAVLDKNTPIPDGQLKLFLAEDEAYNVTTISEAANNWLRIQIDSRLSPDTVWQKLVDSVTSRYPSLEMIDSLSGYMRSVYSVRKFKGGKGEFQVRTRFICSITSKEPLVYKMKIESEMSEARQDWVSYTRVFKEDAQLIEELQSRLSVK